MLVVILAAMVGQTQSARASSAPSGLPAGVKSAKIVGYNDGDKIEISRNGTKYEVNLIAEDAPEPGECYAHEASDYIKNLLKRNQVVYLESDKTDKDGKDRLLRYIWASNSKGKAYMVNEWLISKGYGSDKAKDGNFKYETRLLNAENTAKKKQLGMWKTCGGPHVEIKPTPTPDPTANFTSDELSYVAHVSPIISAVGDALIAFSDETTADDFLSNAWKVRVAGDLAEWQLGFQEISAITPPDAFSGSYNLILQAMTLLNDAADNIANGIDSNDVTLIQTATDEINQANDLTTQANDQFDQEVATIQARGK